MKSFNIKKAVAIYLLVGAAVGATALPSAWKVFEGTYGIKDGSNLANAKCTVCHTTAKGKVLNSYGKDIKSKLSGKKVTASDLHAVESMSSSHTGQSNISRIHADKLPGG